jgi:hypothetical protein
MKRCKVFVPFLRALHLYIYRTDFYEFFKPNNISCNNFATTALYNEPVIKKVSTEKGAKIMNKTWKKFRVILTAAGMAVCMTAGLGLGIYWSRGQAEKTIVAAAEKEMGFEAGEMEEDTQSYQRYADEECLYKDKVLDEEIAKEVCDKYNLDYDTVKSEDVTREMRNYEEALWLLKDMGNRPLLGKEWGKGAFASLQMYIQEIYAFGDGEEVIREMCKGYEIDPDKAVISDLTTEQLIEIGEKAFETSDHPKG